MNKKREEEINDFLKDLFISAKNNNDIIYNERMIYNYLIKYNVSKKDMNVKFYKDDNYELGNELFSRWIDRFMHIPNIDVFCTPFWRYFCQFINGDVNTSECIKMYIPLDNDHIYEGANRIFDFLAKNNINHHSKIGSEIRFDDVVIRLNNKKDADLLQNFVDNDKYIKEGMFKGNPFAFSKNGVNYAFDGHTSYNACLSQLIAFYINDKVSNKSNTHENVNVSDFYSFIDNISKDLDCYKYFQYFSHSVSKEDAFLVVNLIKLSLGTEDIRDYYSFINMVKNKGFKRQLNDNIKNGVKRLDISRLSVDNEEVKEEDKKDLFDEVILTTMKKYPLGYSSEHPEVSGFDFLNNYFKGNIRGITRDNNLRERVKNDLSIIDCYSVINDSNAVGNNQSDKMENYVKMVMLNDMIRSMLDKYPREGMSTLSEYVKTGNFLHVTSNNKARTLAHTLQPQDIKKLFYDLGVSDLYEYANNYYDVNKKKGRNR